MKDIKNVKNVKNTGKRNIAILIQAILAVCLLIIGLMYLWIPELLILLQGLAIAFLWIGAYNSYCVYGKKIMVILYVLAGTIILYDLVWALI